MRILQPADWPDPKGYSNGVEAEGRSVFVAGQVGWDANQRIAGPDFVTQARQALQNIVNVLEEGNAGAGHLTRLTWFVTDVEEYMASRSELGRAYRER